MTVYLSSRQVLGQSDSLIFFDTPEFLVINEAGVTNYNSCKKIGILIRDLQEKGPLMAKGYFGPGFYAEAPFKLKDPFFGQDIYGWKPGTKSTSILDNHRSILILGARKTEDLKEYVFFTMSQDVTSDRTLYVRRLIPCPIDSKIYVMTSETFEKRLLALHPPLTLSSKASSTSPTRTTETEYAQQLLSFKPVGFIIGQGEVQQSCKDIGQKIFDHYKTIGGYSLAGKNALVKILEAVSLIATDGPLRKENITRAWEGVGDDVWQWKA